MSNTPETVEGKILKDSKGRLQGARFVFGGMNFMTDPADLTVESGQCVDLCNVDVDDKANVSRRSGFVRTASGNITSAWANSNKIYCVMNNLICTVSGSIITPMVNSPIMLDKVEFKQVNNVVAYSDGVTIGIIENDTIFVFSDAIKFE